MSSPHYHSHSEPKHGFTFVPPDGKGLEVTEAHPRNSNKPFEPLPRPTGKPPFHLSLGEVLSTEAIEAIHNSGQLVFHIVGDTGDNGDQEAASLVAQHLVKDFERSDPADHPAFFYHLGDVIYPCGEASNYNDQFYDPYDQYPAPILAIPGNHDGRRSKVEPATSLAAFMGNFCAPTPQTSPDDDDEWRATMTQPNCYWTLEAPFVTIIGLYTNVPEGGELDGDQKAWLESELRTAPGDKALLVAMHQPICSLAEKHKGSVYMRDLLDEAIQKAGRVPDAVLAGHAHNYQRFTRALSDRDLPYILAGAGGNQDLHSLQEVDGMPIEVPYPVPDTDLTLESYCDWRHGFMRLTITSKKVRGAYFTVPRRRKTRFRPARKFDSFKLDLRRHRLV